MRKNITSALFAMTLLSGITFVSCKDKALSVIPVESVEDIHFVDALTDSHTYLVLDDSSVESILGEITEVMIDGDLIFISSVPNAGENSLTGQELSVFDKNGKFLHRIGRRGRAQNEYLYLSSWALDKANREVYMLDRSSDIIKRYSYDGEYISQIDLTDETSTSRMFMIGNKLYIQTLMPYDKRDDLVELNLDGTCRELFERRDIGTNGWGFSGGHIRKSSELKSFYHLRPLDNTLYHISDDGQVDSCGYFDFIMVPTQAKMRNLTTEDADYLMTIPSVTYESADYYIVVIAKQPVYVLSKSTGKLMGYKRSEPDFFTSVRGTIGVTDDMIICGFSSEDAKHGMTMTNAPDDLKTMYRDMAESENESLIFYRLKK